MSGEVIGRLGDPAEHGLVVQPVAVERTLAATAPTRRLDIGAAAEAACDYAAAAVFGAANVVAAVGNFVKRRLY